MRRGAPLLLALGLLATACSLFDRGLDPLAADLVRSAELQAQSGANGARLAIARIERALAEEPNEETSKLLLFALGWLHDELANDLDAGARATALDAAARRYGEVLALDKSYFLALKNLALVRVRQDRVQEAIDLLEDRQYRARLSRDQEYERLVLLGSAHPEEAWLASKLAYEEAFRLIPTRTEAPARLLGMHPRLGEDEIERLAEEFAAAELERIAMLAYRILIRRTSGAEGRFIARWIELAAPQGALFDAATDQLAPIDEWPEFAREGLRALAADPDEQKHEELLKKYWLQEGEARRRHVLALAIQSIAAAKALAASTSQTPNPQRLERVVDYYRCANRLGPAPRLYLPKAPLAGRRPAAFDAAIDLAVFFHTHEEVDPDGTRFDRLLDSELSEEALSEVQHNEGIKEKYLSLLGLVFAEREGDENARAVGRFPRERAIHYLERALKVHGEQPVDSDAPSPQPFLSQRLATVLAASSRPVRAIESYYRAAKGYNEAGDRFRALRMLEAARRVRADGGRINSRFRDIEDELYPPFSLYAGLSVGYTTAHESHGELEAKLADLGNNTRINLDDTDFGLKAIIGLRISRLLAAEVGFTELGSVQTGVAELAPPMANLVTNVRNNVPTSGRGATLAGLVYPYDGDLVALFAKGGVWMYWAKGKTVVNGAEIPARDSRGINLLLGGGAEVKVSYSLRLRAEYERYFLENNFVDFFSIGFLYRL